MPVFRVEKTKDFTVMSNYHLRDKNISLKAKGLLSVILSLPDDWNYSLKGLAKISKEEVDAIRTGISELQKAGYIERNRLRDEKGKLKEVEYIIHEQPIDEPTINTPIQESPTLENPILDKPLQENPTQLNTNISNTEILNTDDIKYTSINSESLEEGWIDRYNLIISEIKEQIEYDSLITKHDPDIINNILNVMVDVMLVDKAKYRIEDTEIEQQLVRIRYRQITYGSLSAFLMEFKNIYYKINNPKAYLITALYNVSLTADTALVNQVNCDMH